MKFKDNKCHMNTKVVPIINVINQPNPQVNAEEAEVVEDERFSLPEGK